MRLCRLRLCGLRLCGLHRNESFAFAGVRAMLRLSHTRLPLSRNCECSSTGRPRMNTALAGRLEELTPRWKRRRLRPAVAQWCGRGRPAAGLVSRTGAHDRECSLHPQLPLLVAHATVRSRASLAIQLMLEGWQAALTWGSECGHAMQRAAPVVAARPSSAAAIELTSGSADIAES